MTKIRLMVLTEAGLLDGDDNSFTVSKEEYDSLQIPPEFIEELSVKKTFFHEIYRDHSKNPEAKHPALEIGGRTVSENLEYEKFEAFYVIWIEKESRWIAFRYTNIMFPTESYGASVETACPMHGPIYRLNDELAGLVKQYFDLQVPVSEVYRTAP